MDYKVDASLNPFAAGKLRIKKKLPSGRFFPVATKLAKGGKLTISSDKPSWMRNR